nr:bromodomain-containing protein DDB_G0270170-like [Ipomoea batatas]
MRIEAVVLDQSGGGEMYRSVLKDGQSKNPVRRNSPRLSALNASKETQQKKASEGASEKEECHGDKKQGQPSKTRAGVKRKFSSLAAKHVSEGSSHGQQRGDQPANNSVPTKLPEKRLLELILDILQRRDAYEIFAEPVDPNEVKDYYEIIKNPMDFGTMRAKLHEGMYENLEQFEHDAFLIPDNAMNFNSPGTIYFRQARGICDLAKKVFHVLKTDPENFEMEFAGTKRRSIRKLQNETKELSKPQKDAKPDNPRPDIAANGSLFCLGAPSTLARSSKGSPRFGGNGDAPRSCSAEVSRRSTYTNWKSSLENECPKPAIPLNELNESYRESLTRFVEGLGPTAKRIANRKLQALEANIAPVKTPSFQVPTAYATFQMPSSVPSISSSSAPASDPTLPDSIPGFGPPGNLPSIAETANKQKNSNKTAPGSVLQYKRSTKKVSETEKRAQNRGKISEKQPEDASKKTTSSKQPAGSSVIVDTRKPDDSKFRPIVLALEQSSPPELKARNRRSTNASTLPPKSQNKSTPAPPCKSNAKADKASNSSSSSKAPALQPPATQPTPPPSLPLLSGFTFNMPFLKAQLNQMNPSAAAAHTWDTRLFEATPRIAPRDYLRFGSSVSSSALNLAPNLDEHQQIPPPRACLYGNNSTANNAQSSWQSLAPPLDSDLSLQLYK